MLSTGHWGACKILLGGLGGLSRHDVISELGALHAAEQTRLGFSEIREPQDRHQNTIILIMESPKEVPLRLGNPHFPQVGVLGPGALHIS